MIHPSELSFCIQGPFQIGQTDLLLESLFNLFPESEIVYAIWEVDLVKFNNFYKTTKIKLIPLEDPGSYICVPKDEIYINAQRQIYSSRKALESAKNKFAVKIRSDLFVKDKNILYALNNSNETHSNKGIHIGGIRIGVLNVTSINPRFGPQMPYHLCDWLYVGLRQDLLDLFSTDYPEDKFASWYTRHEKPQNNVSLSTARYATECFIFSKYVKKHINIEFNHSFDSNNGNLQISEQIIADKIDIYRLRDLGIEILKSENRKLLRFQKEMYQPIDLRYMRSEIGYFHYIIVRTLFNLRCNLFNILSAS